MRVFVISHTVFSATNNMGKTLLSYFQDFRPEEVAQFYVHSQIPTDGSVCQRYYRMTDFEAVKSALTGKDYGTEFSSEDIQRGRASGKNHAGFKRMVYRFGERRTALGYVLRNAAWKRSRWNSEKLWRWVEEFQPDVVFFMAGDYGFLYDIAREIADHLGKPLAVACVDDHYLYNRNQHSLLGRLEHCLFLRTVHKTMARASVIFTICPSMAREYEALFQKPCRVLHTAAPGKSVDASPDGTKISYIGNLSYGRHSQLLDMGRVLRRMGQAVDVYSQEEDPRILKLLTEENGIRFHGPVPAEQVSKIMSGSMAVIHTESFEEWIRQIVRFSVSTKIAESLMAGPCLIAYGPEGTASIDYLKENGAAYVITSPEKLASGLEEILSGGQLRQSIVKRARLLAQRNHNPAVNAANVRKWLGQVCGGT